VARAASGEAFDVVLCDLQMPDVDGVAVHTELQRVRPDLVPRLVFMSGGAVGDRTRAFATRADIVLLDKPFTLDHLLAALDRIPA
jgi:CheY-like chemotaxis protein